MSGTRVDPADERGQAPSTFPTGSFTLHADVNILVRAPNWIGDQILAYPFFHYLRQARPRARIVVACVGWVSDLQFRNLIDEVVVLPRPLSSRLGHKLKALEAGAEQLRGWAARNGAFDEAYSLPNSFSAAWLLWRSGAQKRTGYRGDARGLLLNDARAWNPDPGRHRAQAYVDLLPADVRPELSIRDFWGVPPENDLDPGTPGVLPALDVARAWPSAQTLESPVQGPYWVLAPGATAESRRWPAEMFVRLVEQVHAATGWTGIVIGGPSEALLGQELATMANQDGKTRLIDLTAECPVTGLWKILRGARFTLCNESGLAHMAALCGSFTQIVCGAADPRRTRPLGPGRVQVVVNPLECWPCERNVCSQPPAQKIQCLRGIRPSGVWEEIQRGLKLEQN